MLSAFLHGFIMAFGLILPPGAQNVFIFNQGASQRKFKGIPVIITASICDALLILLSVLGVSVMVSVVPIPFNQNEPIFINQTFD